MDNIKEKIEEVIEKVKKDPEFAKKFQEEPIKAVESIIGYDLPDDKIKDIINMIKTKLKLDDNNILGKIKGIFN